MGGILCHHDGKFNFYNTISDGFRFEGGLTQGQVISLVRKEQGTDGLDKLPDRIRRAVEKGTSSHLEASLEQLVCCNRAGDNEAHLDLQQILDRFFR